VAHGFRGLPLVVRDSEPVGGYPYARWHRMAGVVQSQRAHETQTGRSVNRQSEIHTTVVPRLDPHADLRPTSIDAALSVMSES
jgi:hypothetical protein